MRTTTKALLSVLAVAVLALGWTSAGDVKITGSLLSKIQRFYGATGTNFLKLPDNLASALIVEDFENGADLLTVATTDSSESIAFAVPVSFASPSLVGVGGAVAATGTTKTDATALTKEYNTITGTALQGVSLATAAVGKHQVVYNDSAVALIVYPLDAGNDTLAVNDLAALSADVGYAVGPLGTLDCTAYTTTAWHCLYKPGSRSTVVAAGTNQGSCTQLGSVTMGSTVAVTVADATKAVCLPTGGTSTTYIPGCVTIQSTVNTNTAYLPVFGSATDDDTINGAAGDAVFTMGAGSRVTFCTIDGVAWLTR